MKKTMRLGSFSETLGAAPLAAAGWALLFLNACTVGPKYVRPTPPAPIPPDFKEAQGWKPAQPGDQTLRGNWWEIFGDPQLNALEEQVNVSNQDLKAAEARLREARALIRVTRASEFPVISTAPSITSLHSSTNGPNVPPGTAYSATGDFVLPFDLSYELDLWGRIRRTVAAAREEAQATAADLETARLSLHAELALDYFELRSADAQQRLLNDTVKAYTDALKLTTDRYEGGLAPKSDVAQAQTQLQTTRVQATDIAVARSAFEHAIAILIGKPPAAFNLPPRPLDIQPPNIPPGLPSQLLERRPDIAAVERRVAEANEQVGIARVAFFPAVTLDGTAGFEGHSITTWLTWPSRFWAIGPTALETLFDAGRRRASSEAALGAYDVTVATYRETTLTAFQQVEDNLAALRILQQEAGQQAEAVASAQESLRLFTVRYKGGVDTYLQVITAQTIALANERNDVDVQRRRMDASVLLIKALGGGWNVAKLPVS
ncbi:MAG: efflux transporter outer membrane subunit [Terriglobia bacterium]